MTEGAPKGILPRRDPIGARLRVAVDLKQLRLATGGQINVDAAIRPVEESLPPTVAPIIQDVFLGKTS